MVRGILFSLTPGEDIQLVATQGGVQRYASDIPARWKDLLSDLSPGMVAEAKNELQPSDNFTYLSFDVQSAPLASSSFEAILANHMLYHIPDVDQALAEIHRLLKPGGRLYATTNGERHLGEIAELARQAEPASDFDNPFEITARRFGLESGRAKLEARFGGVETRLYEDALRVTEVEPIIRFIRSSSVFRVSDAGLARLEDHLGRQIQSEGAVDIGKDTGMLIARKAEAD